MGNRCAKDNRALVANVFDPRLDDELIALNAEDRFSMLTAFGATALLAIQTFVIIGGVIKLIPLTGITMPFVSYGGSSMIACLLLIGILEGIASRSGAAIEDALIRAADEAAGMLQYDTLEEETGDDQ